MDLPQVKCPHCGAANPEDAFFCGECGGQVRSLMAAGSGPVEEVDGDIEIKPLFEESGAPPLPASEVPVPPPPPSPAASGQPEPPSSPLPPAIPRPPRPPSAAVQKLLAKPHEPSPYGGHPRQPGQQSGTYSQPPAAPSGQPYQPPSAGRQYQPPPTGQPYDPYQPPSGGFGYPPPGYGQPGGYPPSMAPGYGMGPDANTSGMGENYPTPPEADGSTFAGCLPYGVFGFANKSSTWGIIGLLTLLPYVGLIASLVYFVYIYSSGKKLAWRNRRFDSVEQFTQTMNVWNQWGTGCLVINLVGGVIFAIITLWMEIPIL